MKLVKPNVIDDTVLVSSNVPETEPEWAAGTYAKFDQVRVGHDIYESLQDGNTDEPTAGLLTDPPSWGIAGKTNRHKMFDITRSTDVRTSNPDEITTILQPAGIVTSLTLLGLYARTVDVLYKDADDNVVYEQSYDLFDSTDITNWWLWFHLLPRSEQRLAILDLPGITGGTLTVTINHIGDTAECGKLLIGTEWDPGKTQPEPPTRLIPVGGGRQRDAFGNLVFISRRVFRETDFSVLVRKALYDSALSTLKDYMTSPIVIIGSQIDKSAIMFGAIKGPPQGKIPTGSPYGIIKFTAEEI